MFLYSYRTFGFCMCFTVQFSKNCVVVFHETAYLFYQVVSVLSTTFLFVLLSLSEQLNYYSISQACLSTAFSYFCNYLSRTTSTV